MVSSFDEKQEHHGGVYIHGSTVMIGNRGDYVTMGMPSAPSRDERNHQDEVEILRIYRKLDVRHKSDFMGLVFAYEDEYDKKV